MNEMPVERMQVLLAVKALEPGGYGEAIRLYLKSCNVPVRRAPVYRQLSALKALKYIKVVKSVETREELATTKAGRDAAHRWIETLCRVAKA